MDEAVELDEQPTRSQLLCKQEFQEDADKFFSRREKIDDIVRSIPSGTFPCVRTRSKTG